MTSTGTLPLIGSRSSQPAKNPLKYSIVPVLVMFHIGAVAALFFFSWTGLFVALFFILGHRRFGTRHLLSPAADPSLFRDSQVVRVLSYGLRRNGHGRRASSLGGDSS